MALTKEIRLAIEAKLRMGISPKKVSEQLDVKLPTVYAINQKLEASHENELVKELHATPQSAITTIVTEAKKTELSNTTISSMDAVVVGADGLKKLDMAFQTTVMKALTKFDALLDSDNIGLKDIKLIIDTTSNAYEKIFNAGTNIHIGDNNSHSSNQLTIFKNKQGV